MPRRRSNKAGPPAKPAPQPALKRTREDFEEPESAPESESGSPNEFEEGSSQDGFSDEDEEEEMGEEMENYEDADAPRVVQWDDDDDLDYERADEQMAKKAVVAKPKASQLTDLENNLKSLPLGTLRKAQTALYQAEMETDNEDENSGGSESEVSVKASKPKEENVKWTSKETHKKRANKNAPMEVTSKKPVTRNRTIVKVPKIVARDPRFLPVAGEFKPEAFQKSYGFLAEAHKTEVQTLRENLKRANKLLATSPRDQLEEREAEVERLERAVKRAESLVNKDRQDAIQRDALTRAKTAEKEKRKSGKGEWYMKRGEKREVLNKARFEAIAATGGSRAVKKAIDKKQKKVSQKEKKSRPYAKGAFDKADTPARKRFASASSGEGRPQKKFRAS